MRAFALGQQLGQGRNGVVALNQRGPGAGACDQVLVQCPHGLGHGRVVAVDEQRVAQARVGMVAREVDLGDGLHRKGVQVVVGAGAQVVGAEVQIVHVQ